MPDTSQIGTYARLLRLTPAEGAPILADEKVDLKLVAIARSRRRFRFISPNLMWIALPMLVAAGYLWGLATDRYESEAKFVLRMPARSLIGGQAAALLQTAGVTRANDDGYVVTTFIESRDAVAWMEKRGNLRQAIGKAGWDPLWRFPNPIASDTEEGLYKHAQRFVSTSFDATTGVSTLRVQAFAPGDAHVLAKTLLEAAEGLINRLNERARSDAIKLAEIEVKRMTSRALASQAAVTAFREREQLIDPEQMTLAVFEGITRLSVETSLVSIQIAELTKNSPKSPQIESLRTRQEALEIQMTKERLRLAGDAKSIAPRIAEYERLMLEREFAQRALLAALTMVETARVEAQRYHVYLERVAEPSQPDRSAYPWRIVWLLVAGLVGFMASRIWNAIATDAHAHTEL